MSHILRSVNAFGAPEKQASSDLDNAFCLGPVQSSRSKHYKTRVAILESRGLAENCLAAGEVPVVYIQGSSAISGRFKWLICRGGFRNDRAAMLGVGDVRQ